MKNILAIGHSIRNIVYQGMHAGYNIYAIDRFCDFDLKKYAMHYLELDNENEVGEKEIIELIEQFEVEFDAIIFGSGFEHIDFTQFNLPILNNEYKIMSGVSDKNLLSKKLHALNIPHPHTLSGNDIKFAKYPLMAKPKKGGGGVFNRVIKKEEDAYAVLKNLSDAKNIDYLILDDLVFQNFIEGISVSVSVLSTKNDAMAISVNEQLIGIDWLTNLPFAYCGNITPFKTKYEKKMCDIAKEAILELGLIGSNGIDFIISEDGPIVIEINPRIQGTIDTIELAMGINMFQANLNALNGVLPDEPIISEKYAARAILYAKNSVIIDECILNELVKNKCRDISDIGSKIDMDSPITSIISMGKSRSDVIEDVKNIVKNIESSLNQTV